MRRRNNQIILRIKKEDEQILKSILRKNKMSFGEYMRERIVETQLVPSIKFEVQPELEIIRSLGYELKDEYEKNRVSLRFNEKAIMEIIQKLQVQIDIVHSRINEAYNNTEN